MKMSKGWKRFLGASAALFTVAGVVALLLPDYRNLSFLFFYSIPANSFVPFPHEPALVFLGRSYHPVVVAFAAVAGTMIACFVDYKAINLAFRNPRIERTRESDVYKGAVHYFMKAPFFAIWFAALVPFIPFYIFRILSPASGYPLHRYVVAVFLGRFPRYLLVVLVGNLLNLTNLMLAGGAVFFICVLLGSRVKAAFAARHRLVEQSVSIDRFTLGGLTLDEKTAVASD
jgi:membrane protein YqaA with SNARE-associated domain